MSKHILSIIIPAYNVEKFIEKCLVSTQHQGLPSDAYEVIVVNDGSPDNSLLIAKRLAVQYSNIRIVSRPNGGLSAARNTGIAEASGDYYFFLDSDDWIDEDALSKIISKLESDTPDILNINMRRTDGNVTIKEETIRHRDVMDGPSALKSGINPMAQMCIISASFMDMHNFRFTEGIYHEDVDLTPRMYYKARKVSFLNECVYNYYVNTQSITSVPNPKKSYDLVDSVCEHLSEFAASVATVDKYIFNRLISMYYNNALNGILKCNDEEQIKFQHHISTKKHLLDHLTSAPLQKYRIEGHLFKCFPRYILLIYKNVFRVKK